VNCAGLLVVADAPRSHVVGQSSTAGQEDVAGSNVEVDGSQVGEIAVQWADSGAGAKRPEANSVTLSARTSLGQPTGRH
jgi:hypothetical protein